MTEGGRIPNLRGTFKRFGKCLATGVSQITQLSAEDSEEQDTREEERGGEKRREEERRGEKRREEERK
jgi:hypothetical protein